MNKTSFNLKNLLIILLGIFLFVSCQPSETDGSGQVVHLVLFWLKNPGSESDRKQLMEGLNTLREIKEVKKLIVGIPASTLERDVVDSSFDVSELMIFESIEAQDAYQVHPLHQEFIDSYSHLWDKVVVYDVLAK